MRKAHWQAYASPDASLPPHAAHLLWADGVILVYPTWWQGPPAMMKGWMEQVWRPGVAFELEGQHLRPLLKLKVLGVVTTLGAPNWLAAQVMAFTGRRMVLGGLAACAPRGLRKLWLALHAVNSTTPERRAGFLARVHRTMATLGD
jgi:NAD(P)H dehydrogenase (quinone)